MLVRGIFMLSKKIYYVISSVLLVLCIAITVQLDIQADEIQKEIAGEVIRFHVRANSNSKEDQQLKMGVKEEVILYLKNILADSESIDETRKIMTEHIDVLETIAKNYIMEHGCDYDVQIKLDKEYFPVKTYGDVTFPKGIYEALVIEIGAAKGNNWWCVIYPSLCFIDAAYSYVPEESKEQLKDVLTEEAFDSITDGEITAKLKIFDIEW